MWKAWFSQGAALKMSLTGKIEFCYFWLIGSFTNFRVIWSLLRKLLEKAEKTDNLLATSGDKFEFS